MSYPAPDEGNPDGADPNGDAGRVPERASALRLLRLPRGHWAVEHCHHFPRDGTLDEESSRSRTGPGPAGSAALHNLALELLLPSGRDETLPLAQAHCRVWRAEALRATQEVPGRGEVASGLARLGAGEEVPGRPLDASTA